MKVHGAWACVGTILLYLLMILAIPAMANPDTRQDSITSTGNMIHNRAGGHAHTWQDPATGDVVTSVIAPRPKQEARPPTPIYVYPQIAPDWPQNHPTRPEKPLPPAPR